MVLETRTTTSGTTRAAARTGFLRCLGAELFSARRRPGVRIAALLWGLQIAVFAYAAQYLVYRSMGEDLEAGQSAAMLAAMQPEQLGAYAAASVPGYGIPVFVVLGALVAAGDYRWGVLRAILVRFPARGTLLAARWVCLQVLTLVLNVVGFLVALVGTAAVAVSEGGSPTVPSLGSVVVPFLTSWLIMVGYSTVGFTLGIVLRSVMAAALCALGWLVAVELLLIGSLAGAMRGFELLQHVLLTANAGSLVSALANTDRVAGTGLPGLASVNGPGLAALVVLAWTVVGLVTSIVVFRRRDVP
ncbi:ABC transporter permease subunit [Modestobacter sp. VKM Ac-2977]|uniref:ABC transporter permease subunit n=1 Tax=Modestobacter sp. VKM Ac-2977 TaxID=3004131 RepID=UPI0022AA0CE5|nr:ABC transporter permease subunit [Modestobacter sp. VKM Ac-2977]MCZ2819838.1 ABC transporter permease subunit [Modestobacter sp. VKM Ac-2977]